MIKQGEGLISARSCGFMCIYEWKWDQNSFTNKFADFLRKYNFWLNSIVFEVEIYIKK